MKVFRAPWPGPAAALVLALFLGGCEERHGFLKIGAAALFADTDRLSCGEAKIAPGAGGLVDAFVTLKPQDCMLTLHRGGSWFGTELCNVHIGPNRITTVYVVEGRTGLSCGVDNT